MSHIGDTPRSQEPQAPEPASTGKLTKVLLGLLLLVTLGTRLGLAWADHHSTIQHDFLQDDAFYYFQIARNATDGRGFTFDGEIPTSGFHPLYFGLLLPVMKWSGGDLATPIHLSGTILTLFAVATCWLLFLLGRRLTGPWTGLLLAGLWTVSPYFLVYSVNGLETGIAACFAVLITLVYVSWFRDAEPPSRGKSILLGAVLGLGVLARLDLAILAVAVGIDWLYRTVRAKNVGEWVPSFVTTALAALCLWLPWGALCYSQTSNWLAKSGSAGRDISLSFGWIHLDPCWPRADPEQVNFPLDEVPAAFHADVASKFTGLFLFDFPPLAPLRIAQPFAFWPELSEYLPYSWFAEDPERRAWVFAGIAAIVLLLVFPWSLSRSRKGIGFLAFSFFFASFLGYTFLAPIHWFFSRYLVPSTLLATVAFFAAVGRWLAPVARGHSGMARMLPALGSLLCLLPVTLQYRGGEEQPFRKLRWSETPPTGFLQASKILQPELDKGQRLGAFQAGILAYFTQADVVNLDGKVNPEAGRALREGTMVEYMREREIDLVCDWNWIVYALCLRQTPEGMPAPLRHLTPDNPPWAPQLYGVLPAVPR